MSILYLLIPLSLILLALAVWAFFWAVDNKQFDDLEGPAYSILFDDDDPRHTGQARPSTSSQQGANAPKDISATETSSTTASSIKASQPESTTSTQAERPTSKEDTHDTTPPRPSPHD